MFLFVVCGTAVHFGIDFGSQFAKTSIVGTNASPEIAMNYETRRTTPMFFGFRVNRSFDTLSNTPLTDSEAETLIPVLGEKAVSVQQARPGAIASFLPLFVDATPEYVERLKTTLYAKATAARVAFKDVLALWFKFYMACVGHGKQVTTVTVAVPATFTVPQRRQIEQAVTNAGFRFLKCIDDIDAVANIYAVEKTNKFASEPKTVLFIDIGAASVKAYALRFRVVRDSDTGGRATAERMSYVIAEEQGGAYLTMKVAQLIKTKLGLTTVTDGENSRIIDAAEHAKLKLTLLKECTVMIEDIGDDDKSVTLTRDEIDIEAAELVQTVLKTAREAVDGIEYHDIELLGGSSRLPLVLAGLRKEFSVELLGHSLNADEGIAMGAGYHAQFHAGTSRYAMVRITSLKPVHTLAVKLYDGSQTVCTRNVECTNETTVEQQMTEVVLEYGNDPFLDRRASRTFAYKVGAMLPTDSLQLQFSESPPDLKTIKLCNDTGVCMFLKVASVVPMFAASPTYTLVTRGDLTRKRMERVRSELEQFALRILDDIEHNESVIAFTSSMEKHKIIGVAEKVRDWLWNEAEAVTDERNFTSRFGELRSVMTSVHERMAENRTFTVGVQMMLQTLQVAKYTTMLEWPINKTFINKTEIDTFKELLNETETWFMKMAEDNRGRQPYEGKTVRGKEITDRSMELYRELMRINSIKPPPPPYRPTMKERASGWFGRVKSFFTGKNKTASPGLATKASTTPLPEAVKPDTSEPVKDGTSSDL